MKILLVNSNRFKYPWPVIPIGLCSVAASIEQAGYEVYVLDLCFSKDCAADIIKAVNTIMPDIIGISIRNIDTGTAYNTQFFLDDVKNNTIIPIKKHFQGPIIIGGTSVGISGAEMLEFFDLEYAIRGDGEIAMVEFIKCLGFSARLKELKGLIIRKEGKIIHDPAPLLIEDLNALPFPSPQRYLDLRPYQRFGSAVQIQTKRGCALKCTYCTYNQIEGYHYRFRRPELIAQEIETIVKETGIKHIEFTDSTFNIPLEHTKAVLRALEKKNLGLRLRTMDLNPEAVDEELVDLMQQTGFQDVALGADAGSDIILSNLGKNYRKVDLLRTGKLLRQRNMPVIWSLLVGASEETQETLTETLNTVIQAASPWDLIGIGVGVRIYKGSLIAKQMARDKIDDNFLYPIFVSPKKIGLDSLRVITKRAALRHPNFFIYDEDEDIPFFIMKLGIILLKIFASRQPIWRIHILFRTIEKWTGLGLIKIALYEINILCRRYLPTAGAMIYTRY